MNTFKDYAQALAAAFETATNREGKPFIKLKDDRPEWMVDVVRRAHDGLLPNDWTYSIIRDVANAVVEYEGDLDEDGVPVDVWTIADSVGSVLYTHELLDYVGSGCGRWEAANEALTFYNYKTIDAAINCVYADEAWEVTDLLVDSLRQHVEAQTPIHEETNQ